MAQPQNKNPLKDKMTDDELDLSISNYTDKDVPVKDIVLLKRATKLDLSNNKLTGLPKSFASLTHLVKIDLSCNVITELPSNFGELHRLKHLDLYNNKLSHLPLSFHQLTSLRWLDLKNNPLSVQLAEAAGECLNPRECEQCARRVVQFMGRVKEHYDQERLRRQQHEKELMDAKLAVEEAEKERLRLEKKAKKEQKKQELRDRKKIEDIQHIHMSEDQLKAESPVKPKHFVAQKMEKPGHWSALAKVNMLLLLMVVAMVGGAVYVHTGGDVSRSGLHSAVDSAAANLVTLSALCGHHGRRAFDSTLSLVKHASEVGTRAGDVLVRQSLTIWEWSAERTADVDRYLTDSQGPAWSSVKATVGGAWRTGDEYARLAGQKAFVVGAHAARRTWEAVEAGGAAARETAGPLWEATAVRGTAVKAGVLEAAARLRRDAGPTLLEWAAAGQRTAADGWAALQREAPGYAAAVWAATWRAGSATWHGAVAAWQMAAAETPAYAAMAADQFNRLVAAVTGG